MHASAHHGVSPIPTAPTVRSCARCTLKARLRRLCLVGASLPLGSKESRRLASHQDTTARTTLMTRLATPTERGSFDSHHNLDALLSAPKRFDRGREGFDSSPRNCCTGYKIEAREQPVELLHHHRQLWRRAAPTSRQWRRWRRRRRRTREWCSALPRRYSQSSTRP